MAKPQSPGGVLLAEYQKLSRRQILIVAALAVVVGAAAVAYIYASAGRFTVTAYAPGLVASSATKNGTYACGPYNDDGRLLYTRKTASGNCPREGATVAVDRNVVALGTTVCIAGVGTRVAQESGAWRGQQVSVFLTSTTQARQFGHQSRIVTWPGACGTGQ
jgi:3D (Asp-Asp-Asp) domain-containing protein